MNLEIPIEIFGIIGSVCCSWPAVVLMAIMFAYLFSNWQDKQQEKSYLKTLNRQIICPYCKNQVVVQFYDHGYQHCGQFVSTGYLGTCPNCKKTIFLHDLPDNK